MATSTREIVLTDDLISELTSDGLDPRFIPPHVELSARIHATSLRGPWPRIALVAHPVELHTQRLQTILDNGAPFGLVGLLLSQWRSGISAYVRDDGTVSSASPGPGQALLGTRMFHLPEAETAQLLTLLRQAQPDPTDARDATDDAASDAALEVTASTDEAGNPPHHEHHSAHTEQRTADEPGLGRALAAAITLNVLGRPRVHWTLDPTVRSSDGSSMAQGAVRDITAAFPPRQRE